MDLDLSDEQVLLSESIDTLLARTPNERLWKELVSFGAFDIGGDEGLGAVELCLVCRALGRRLASAPYLDGAALRYALAQDHDAVALRDAAVALALVEPGRGWNLTDPEAIIASDGRRLDGAKLAVEHAEVVDQLAVLATRDETATLAIVPRSAAGVSTSARPALDPTLPMYAVDFDGVDLEGAVVLDARVVRGTIDRLSAIGALLAAAESVGAASRMLEDSCGYAAERRQFGHPIGSFQALRHLLADMYVRQSSAWSTILYAAATLDLESEEAAETASIAKAYVARATREVAHGAMQVFGGIAFTAEHQAHRFLRRILVRNQQFGDAAHHEQILGRQLAERVAAAAS
jgi:alkylation response protein AidB-like acyl-CoA dehydrogenase